MKRILYLLIPLFVLAACSSPEAIDATYRWPKSGVPQADSLLLAFERARTDINVDFSIRSQIMARFCSVADAHPDNRILAMRRLYIQTCERFLTDPHSATVQLEKEMEQFDSAYSPYDWHSLQSLLIPYEKNIYRKYTLSSRNVEFFEKAGAEMDLGRNLMVKGNVLCELNDTAKALECYDRAEEIFTRQNAYGALYATKLNTLPLLDPVRQGKLLDELLHDTVVSNYPNVYVPACQTAYYITDSVEYLDRAIKMATNYAPTHSLLPTLLSMKAYNLTEHGLTADALSLTDSIRATEAFYNPSTRYRVAIHHNLAGVYEGAGMKDSCISELIAINFWTDSLQREANYRQIYNNEARLHLEAVQKYNLFKHRTIIIWWVLSLIAVIGASVIFYKRKTEKRREQIRLLDERIDNQRRLNMVQESILDNNEKMVGRFETVVKSVADQSLSPSEAITRLRRLIGEYQREEDSQKGFLTVSREIDNSFSQRLKKDFPEISESQLRLASMIAAGMDSHQLCSTLNISTKSLYTSRYRLRTRLNLPKEASLEDFLRQYAAAR